MRLRPRPEALASALAASLLLAACGSAARHATVAVGPPPRACEPVVMRTITDIAGRAYDEVARGRLIGAARVQVRRAPGLTAAVAAGDGRAATVAAGRLLARTQIAFLRIWRGPRELVNLGVGPAIAGTSGVLRRGGRRVGRFALAVQGDAGYAAVVHGLTGAAILVRHEGAPLAATVAAPSRLPADGRLAIGGIDYDVRSFVRIGFAGARERIYLLAGPAVFGACASTASQTVANLIGPLAQRVYAHETASHSERTAVAYIARSRAFTAAVANDSPAGTRAAIITFFRSHRHIVRVRAVRGTRLVNDVGGPFVLAPVAGTLRQDGRVVGRFVAAIQDDAGYVALIHLYTGAAVILRSEEGQVPSSTLAPGPAEIPARGAVSYGGRRYEAYSFDGQRFPSGALRISVLVPLGGAARLRPRGRGPARAGRPRPA